MLQNIYNIKEKNKKMQKRTQIPRRAQSLNIYKPPKSLQLPRFYSKPKNNLLSSKNNNGMDSEPNSINNQNKNSMRLTRAQMAQIVNKIKQKRYATKSKQKKPISQKKITAYNRCEDEVDQKQKVKKRINSNNLEVRGQNLKDDKNYDSHRRQMTNEKNDTPPKKFTQFKSKSLKNAIKYQQPVEYKQLQNKNSQKIVKIQIKKKHINTELPVHKRKNIKQQKNNQIQCNTQLTTQATQPSCVINEIDRKIWRKMVQIFLNITLDPGNLDWPQEYIVMDKQMIEKKLYQLLEDAQHMPTKSKIRKHICISRVTIYLYSSLILNQGDTKSIIPIFTKLHQSFCIATQIINGSVSMTNDKSAALNRNNQFTVKMLLKLLSKKSVPHQNLLKNMLESSLKIQSIQFIQILDKTLKWQILKMPSFPYLPPSSKELYLVLDLDQTLIHYDYNAELFHVRPFAQQFLKKVSAHYQITIFTAALQEYADQILNQIDPQHCISYKLYRNHLTYIDDVPIKDLSMLGRPMNKTIIVDNISTNYRLQPQNGIQIRSWYDDDNDQILGKLYGCLTKISDDYGNDVRVGIRQLGQFIKQQITKANLIYQLHKEL